MSLRNEMTDASLSEELPYWDFVEHPKPHGILTDGSLVTGIEAGLIDIEAMDGGSINQLASNLRSALNAVSEGVTLQFVLSVSSDFSQTTQAHRERWEKDSAPLIQKIAQSRHLRLISDQESGELYRPRLFIFLRVRPSRSKKPGFFKKESAFKEHAEDDYQETVETLFQNVDSLVSVLSSAGIGCQKLSRSGLTRFVYEFLNPKRSKTEPAPTLQSNTEESFDAHTLESSPWLASTSPREQLVFGDLTLDFDHFTLDSHLTRVVTLKTLPEVTFAGMFSNFLRMPFHYDLVLSIEIPPQADEMAKLNQKRRMAHSLAVTQSNRASDLESESKLSSTEELIRELLNTGQRIYVVQLNVLLRVPHGPQARRELDRKTREVLARFRALNGAEGMEESVGAWKVFKGVLPMAPVALERARKMKTNNLADFLPVYGPREGDQDPAVIFRNRLGGLVGYNPFDPGLPNFNTLVTGSSGAGKSFLNNCILLQELARNLRVFIIDIGGSYKKLTESLGGQYLDVTLSDKYRLNPFHLTDPEIEPSSQKIKSLLSIVELMVAEDEKAKLGKLDRVLLEKAIIELYEANRKVKKIPTLSDLAALLMDSDEPSMKAVSKMLYSWTGDRPYGKLLDGEGSLRTNASVCTFDLKGLSNYPDLQSVMILILTDFILGEIEQDKTHRKRIILDEAWELLKSPAAASFMEYCVRTLRKTGSGITFITQGVEEIVASPIGSAILNNTATKFVMLQRGDSEILRKTLKLNDQELSLIHSLEQRKGEYSEGFMIEGDHRQVVRICPSPLEYWLSTSDAQDNKFLLDLMREGKITLTEALETAAEKFPKGVSISVGEKEAA